MAPFSSLAVENDTERPRKRRRIADGDDLEENYFKRLEKEEEKEYRQKQLGQDNEDVLDEDATSSSGSDDSSTSQPSIEDVPQHEVFDKKLNDQDKLHRTVFLGNVSTEAIKSKTAKRTLTRHLRSVLKTPPQGKRPGKLESIRFRSTAYTGGSGPKKATFAKKELMDKTTTSTNAYAVFTTELAAERVAEKLNGTVVLDRHLRVDYLAKQSEVDHRRCVFVGNLSFVNEETPEEKAGDDSKKRRPTAKEPADAEEGLWRTFSKVGEIESVRVVRDQETRVGKGIAYVQFRSENTVEAALLMNDKKFPPMLPRKLRVMRARKMKVKTTPVGSKPQAYGKNLLGKRSGSVMKSGQPKPGFIFEGHRASSTSKGKPASLKQRHKKRPTSNSTRRGAAFKAAKAKKSKPDRK